MTVNEWTPSGNEGAAAEPPHLHRGHYRATIETYGGWAIRAYDRRRPEYRVQFERSRTPVQMSYEHPTLGTVSLVTPCRQTDGKFEVYVAGLAQRFCCYCCAQKKLRAALNLSLPPWQAWMPYFLVESAGYLHDPRAPKEAGRNSSSEESKHD
ncbi:MAG: hypothetical protein AMXMBFR7_20050 [Planctomycetota bacterium]